jgi:hypothetical protein
MSKRGGNWPIPTLAFRGDKSPTGRRSKLTCLVDGFGIKSDEFHDAFPIGFGGPADVPFPLFNGGIGNAKVQELRELRHGQGKVDPFLAEVLTEGFWLGRVAP